MLENVMVLDSDDKKYVVLVERLAIRGLVRTCGYWDIWRIVPNTTNAGMAIKKGPRAENDNTVKLQKKRKV